MIVRRPRRFVCIVPCLTICNRICKTHYIHVYLFGIGNCSPAASCRILDPALSSGEIENCAHTLVWDSPDHVKVPLGLFIDIRFYRTNLLSYLSKLDNYTYLIFHHVHIHTSFKLRSRQSRSMHFKCVLQIEVLYFNNPRRFLIGIIPVVFQEKPLHVPCHRPKPPWHCWLERVWDFRIVAGY